MSRPPEYARYKWTPIVAFTTLSVGSLLLMHHLFSGGNEHDSSHYPGLDTMPSFAVDRPADAPRPEVSVPPKATSAAAWVCKGFVFVDRGHQEVIVNPVVNTEYQRPVDLISVDGGGAEFAQPQPRADFVLYRYQDGRLVRDGDGRLNRCVGDDPISPVKVHDGENNDRYVLADASSDIDAGQKLASDPATAVRHGVVHAEYVMTDGQIDNLLNSLD